MTIFKQKHEAEDIIAELLRQKRAEIGEEAFNAALGFLNARNGREARVQELLQANNKLVLENRALKKLKGE